MRLCSVSRVNVHRHGVQLLQAAHALQQEYNQSSTLYCFDRPCQEIGCKRFEILQDTHAVCVTQNLFCFLVVDISDVLCRDEKFERIFGIDVANAALNLTLDLLLALLSVTREAKQLVLVCPEDRFVQLDVDVQQDVVQVDDDVLLAVTNDDEEASFLFL